MVALPFLLGLHFLVILRIPLLYREARIVAGSAPATLAGACPMDLGSGPGSTPCVSPALAAILTVASGMGDMAQGAAPLFVRPGAGARPGFAVS